MQQPVQLARSVERAQFVRSADGTTVNEDLRDRAAPGSADRLGPRGRAVGGIDLPERHPFLRSSFSARAQ